MQLAVSLSASPSQERGSPGKRDATKFSPRIVNMQPDIITVKFNCHGKGNLLLRLRAGPGTRSSQKRRLTLEARVPQILAQKRAQNDHFFIFFQSLSRILACEGLHPPDLGGHLSVLEKLPVLGSSMSSISKARLQGAQSSSRAS